LYEPAMATGDEKALLRTHLALAQKHLLWKMDGLSDEELRRPMTKTSTNLIGIVKHLTGVTAQYLISVGGHGIQGVEVESDAVIVRSAGHLALRLDRPYDLQIATDGHVFVDRADGDIEVHTDDGHVRLYGDFDHVDVDTGDGHIAIATLAAGTIRTSDGNVSIGLRSAAVTFDIEGAELVAECSFPLRGSAGHWLSPGLELPADLTVRGTGRIAIALSD